jgi:Bacterial SH3 domain
MRQFWFKTLVGAILLTALGAGVFTSPQTVTAYQDQPTPTGIFVTVTYSDPINVRSGPSTQLYPVVGQLNPGDVVPARGISPGREWILVDYPGGAGWVYASFVSISGGELLILEPPPTPTPPWLPSSTSSPARRACPPSHRRRPLRCLSSQTTRGVRSPPPASLSSSWDYLVVWACSCRSSGKSK